MKLQTFPADRKQMVRKISQYLNVPAIYLRTPTYAFQIGNIIVNRDGAIDCDESEMLKMLILLLLEKGYLTKAPAVITLAVFLFYTASEIYTKFGTDSFRALWTPLICATMRRRIPEESCHQGVLFRFFCYTVHGD